MERLDLLHKLDALVHMESDAASIYAEALNCAKDEGMAETLQQIFADHSRHGTILIAAIERLGGPMPEQQYDVVGRFLHWPTMLHASPCKEGALEAFAAAEHYHNKRYEEALSWETGDEDIEMLLAAFAQDEERHQAFVTQELMATA